MIASRLLPFSMVVGLSVVFAACGGEGLTLPPEGEPAQIVVLDPELIRTGRVAEVLPDLVTVRVTDSRGDAVPGARVAFSFPAGDIAAEASPDTATTGADGQASMTLKLGTVAGDYTGVATVVGSAPPISAQFGIMSLPADANGMSLFSGDLQTATVNSQLEPLVVLVTDANDNPIQNVPIQWTVEGGGTVGAASTPTDANGLASVIRTLGGTAGTQRTIATAEGLVGSPVIFTHTATAGNAAGVTKFSGDAQSGSPGAPLALPLVVEVRDELGNPIAGRPVTWVVGTGGGSVNPETSTTDAAGQASTTWTLGPAVGANTVNAVVSGVGSVTFTATATAGTPSGATSEVSAAPTTIPVGGQSTITVVVRDASNNPVEGASVTVASSGSGNTITPTPGSTGPNGVATFTFSSTVAEAKTITATAGGVAIDDQATITVQRTSSIIEITSDEPDPSAVNEGITVEFTVRGTGGTPSGDVVVTISGGDETCRATLSAGAGSCVLTPIAPGPAGSNNRRVITATYGGDAQFSGDTDTENHRVNAAPQPNTAPTAAFNSPSCTVGQPCQFIDGSSDPDGNIASRAWTFEGGTPPSSTAQNPSVVFATEGPKSVSLTVTDNDGAQDTETKSVTVTVTAPATPSASESDVSVSPNAVPANGTPATITVIVRDASGTRLANVPVSASSSDAGDQITPASTTTGPNGEATFTFSSTAAGEKTITVTAAGVTLNDQPRIQVAALGSSVNITADDPDPSAAGQVIRVTFAVTGEGGSTPTGTVEIFSLAESGVGCTVPAAQGFCDFALNTPGFHQLGAAYSGDAQHETSSDPDGEAHEVTAPPGT